MIFLFFYYIFIVLLITNALNLRSNKYIFYKEYSAIVSLLPFVKLHDLIIIYDSKKPSKIITIDYTPKLHDLSNLILGKDVPGFIRIKELQSWNLETWYKTPSVSIKDIPDYKLRKTLNNVKNLWNKKDMNLYNNNCKHFTNFAIQYLLTLDTFEKKE
jgi:hypothetical protein